MINSEESEEQLLCDRFLTALLDRVLAINLLEDSGLVEEQLAIPKEIVTNSLMGEVTCLSFKAFTRHNLLFPYTSKGDSEK
ncbi:MAG: hypothetical protein F6K10_38925 [Moorea sp. SIO2B7]|nr:hypothetical protein [Moorena sp. SIO2B7]